MNILLSARNRLAAARDNEGGFTLTEMLMAISLLVIFIIIILNFMGTVYPAIVTPMIQNASGTNLKPAQVAAASIYKDIDSYTQSHPDTAPSKAALVSGGYLKNLPPNVVFAFHTYGSPASPQRCVIAYIPDDASSGYTQSNPAAFDSLYGSASIGQTCKRQEAGSRNNVPNWDSE